MAEHVADLEHLGYVVRVPDIADGRAKLIRPTDKTLAAMAVARDALRDIEAEWGTALGESRVTQMRATLEDIRTLYADG